MDRLTHRDNSGEAYTQSVDDMNVFAEPQYRYDERGMPVLENIAKEMRCSVVDRLSQYEDAEEAGKLLTLPCKPGDMVWRICGQRGKKHVAQRRVESIEYTASGEIWIHSTACDVFGKTVFLTREEAEAALKGENK